MRHSQPRRWTAVLAFFALWLGAICLVHAEELNFWQRSSGKSQVLDATNNTNWAANQVPPPGTNLPIGPPAKPNVFQRATTAVGSAAGSVSQGIKGLFKPKERLENSGTTTTKTTFRRPQKPLNADFHVTLAGVQEQSGDFPGAAEQYQRALKIDPNHLPAMLGYGRLHDRQQHHAEALSWYQKATQKHPKQAAAWNDLGLCYNNMNKLSEAAGALEKAVALDPTRKLYRNNLASVLVKLNRSEEAYQQLASVHPQAVAKYNVGYLLTQQNERQLAYRYFNDALTADPNLQEARQWCELLTPSVAQLPPESRAGVNMAARGTSSGGDSRPTEQFPRRGRQQHPVDEGAAGPAETPVPGAGASRAPRRGAPPRLPSASSNAVTAAEDADDHGQRVTELAAEETSHEPTEPPLPSGSEAVSVGHGSHDPLAGPRPDSIGAPSGERDGALRSAQKPTRRSASLAPSRY